jgi:hypothetical protein
VAVTTETVKADRLLRVEEVDAWGEEDFRYQDIEPWAWARLQRRLRIVAARRKALGR